MNKKTDSMFTKTYTKETLLKKIKFQSFIITLLTIIDVLYYRAALWVSGSYKFLTILAVLTLTIVSLCLRSIYKKYKQKLENENGTLYIIKAHNNYTIWILLVVSYSLLGPLESSGFILILESNNTVVGVVFGISGFLFYTLTMLYITKSIFLQVVLSDTGFPLKKKPLSFKDISRYQIIKLHNGNYIFNFINERMHHKLIVNERIKNKLTTSIDC